MRIRRRIKTVIGQLAKRFDIEKSWCRDMWHMASRITRKLLAHNVGSFFNIEAGRPVIHFKKLISAEKTAKK